MIRGGVVLCLFVLLKALPDATGFVLPRILPTFAKPAAHPHSARMMATSEVLEGISSQENKLLPRDRYVATNRFTVRRGKEAAFEKRWATRKSRLASLEGFKYFQLMRRVSLDANNNEPFGDDFNYVSFTIWNDKKAFNAWRNGDAFKEAHGGSDIFSFLKTMISSSFVLAGPPKPAFFDGLLQQSSAPQALPATVDGWRDVAADGVNLLPTEAFVACNRFFVTEASSAAFEKRWADRESKLMTCDGFVSFSMLRRDVKAKGHGVTPLQEGEASYQSTTVWRDRAAFEAWRSGNAFKQAHAGSKPASASSSGTDGRSGGGGGGGPLTPLWSRPPQPVFYEATLVISSPEGA